MNTLSPTFRSAKEITVAEDEDEEATANSSRLKSGSVGTIRANLFC